MKRANILSDFLVQDWLDRVEADFRDRTGLATPHDVYRIDDEMLSLGIQCCQPTGGLGTRFEMLEEKMGRRLALEAQCWILAKRFLDEKDKENRSQIRETLAYALGRPELDNLGAPFFHHLLVVKETRMADPNWRSRPETDEKIRLAYEDMKPNEGRRTAATLAAQVQREERDSSWPETAQRIIAAVERAEYRQALEIGRYPDDSVFERRRRKRHRLDPSSSKKN